MGKPWENGDLHGKSPSLSSVNPLFLWAIFNSELLDYRRVNIMGVTTCKKNYFSRTFAGLHGNFTVNDRGFMGNRAVSC
jgi:hypothetical protein